MLLMLSGSFDVTALIANRVYGLSVPDYRTGWRQRQWRDALRLVDRALADLMEPRKSGADALELVALMRNTVHGEALRSELHQ